MIKQYPMGINKIYNRELSWLQFNDRVLQEAKDINVPLIQRLRFLGIFSNNLDEFIKVRVANLIRFSTHKGRKAITMTGGYAPSALLPLVYQRMECSQHIFDEAYSLIIREMEQEGIFVIRPEALDEEQLAFCAEYFLSVVSVRLAPIIIRKREKLPFLPDERAYFAIKMSNDGAASRYALIEIPVSNACPRFVRLPSKDGRTDIIFLDDIIRLHLDDIFFMFNYTSIFAHSFTIVRDAELLLDDDVSKSMAEQMTRGVFSRERGRAIRMSYDKEMPWDLFELLMQKFSFKNSEMISASGRYHMMRDLMRFPKVNPALESKNPKPLLHPDIDPTDSIIKVIAKQDVMLCYPYQTFNHLIDLLREAAIDPRVSSIKITLYRTANHSKVINALLNAAKNGKQVTVLIELKARFDEEQNIDNTDILQSGGVKVITSSKALKVHSKLIFIERREGGRLKGYTYVGTGNFNENTSTIYSDFGLITANQVIAEDARRAFDYLENPHTHPTFRQLIVSPYYMRDEIMALLEREIKNAKKGKEAYFYGKFNALTDEDMIHQLYKASQAGVKIRLLVRGACCLISGIKDFSDNIEVHSIIDKYLEHARMMIFCNGGKRSTYILSADLMTRNLNRRVEVGVEVSDKNIKRMLYDYFGIQWRDNVKARLIDPPAGNVYVQHGETEHRSQIELYDFFNR